MDDVHQCFECSDGVQIFSTEEELVTHKWEIIRTSKASSHMKCHICSIGFHTFEALLRHYQLDHPARQSLECPGCKTVFVRLYLLMEHLEKDGCQNISGDQLEQRRMYKALAAQCPTDQASMSELGIFDTSGVTLGDYGRYIGINIKEAAKEHWGGREGRGGGGGGGKGITAADFGGGATVGTARLHSDMLSAVTRTARDFRRGDAKGPDLLTDDVSARALNVWTGQVLEPEQCAARPMQPTRLQSTLPLRDAVSQALIPGELIPGESGCAKLVGISGAAGPTATSASKARSGTTGALNDADIMNAFNPDHPSHPFFDVNKYLNRTNGRYNCPNELCRRKGKNFKSAGGLIMHLQSGTSHTTLRIQCPSCLHYFGSVQALMQHCESQSLRCRFRDSEEFLPFMDILTGGVADIKGRNMDMTLEYSVQPDAGPSLRLM